MNSDCQNIIEFTVKQSSLTRLDKLLSLRFEDFSRNKIANLIDEGMITVNGSPCNKKEILKIGDVVKIIVPDTDTLERITRFLSSVFTAISENNRQIQMLTRSLDTLLPKLLSSH